MEGIRICFPLPGSELVTGAVNEGGDDDNEGVKELFSLNLDMGPVGRARLVVCHCNEESNICVKLSVTAEYLGVPLILRVSQFILNADGSLHSKVLQSSGRESKLMYFGSLTFLHKIFL